MLNVSNTILERETENEREGKERKGKCWNKRQMKSCRKIYSYMLK